jgi:predicted transcriptional regulator of viral defense system
MRVMARTTHQRELWRLVREQHGVISRRQLRGLGYGKEAIAHRLATGRLHPIGRGVYAVGRPRITRRGEWMAAVLACEPNSHLSHLSAARLYELLPDDAATIHVSVPRSSAIRRPGITVHRRALHRRDRATHAGIPVTSLPCTLVDIAPHASRARLERAVNEADRLELVDPEQLRAELESMSRRPGLGILRALLDQHTFVLTDSQLERRFLPIARQVGLGEPVTGAIVNGFKVDFYWPDIRLVVETDGLRYHRTPAQQARDSKRDHAHLKAGLTPVRFTHGQVSFEPQSVKLTLDAVVRSLRNAR